MNKLYTFLLLSLTLIIASCGDDDSGPEPVSLNFENTTIGVSGSSDATATIIFSRPAEVAGTLVVTITAGDLVYGASNDFFTAPAAENNVINIPFVEGEESVEITVSQGEALNIEEDKSISLAIAAEPSTDFLIGNNQSVTATFSENYVTPSAAVTADVGGEARDYFYFVDLDKFVMTKVNRNNYDLALESSGEGFNILLNASTLMLAQETEETEFTAITPEDTVGLSLQSSSNLDIPEGGSMFSGDLSETVFYNWDVDGDLSNVYIIDRGVTANGEGAESRGWKKVQISKDGNDYIVHAANIDGTDDQTFTISKSSDYSFKYVHLSNGEVPVEPKANEWDILVRATSQFVQMGPTMSHIYNSQAAYHNFFGSTKTARIDLEESDKTYEDVSLADATSALNANEEDFNTIGISWRGLGENYSYVAYPDQVYIIEDANGNIFKLQFTSYYNNDNETGPQFQFEHLN
ncbi:HmuY family protein [Fulvivirga ligni]|uniref:HmuY family protein n=1 Tax=Fulvivirga ligni TaxID=2904246 RepID=UPI001F42EDF3|nr:HmuY family protein [Fulvivirga ligni]UII19673.1 HmuY family protein [Fulvivirga ligni]